MTKTMPAFYRWPVCAARYLNIFLALLACLIPSHLLQAQEQWPLVLWDDPDEPLSFYHLASEAPRATQGWQLCIIYPHLKDGYWLAVNYGMAQEARRLGVGFKLTESGGYNNLEEQRQQLTEALEDQGCHALLLGTISYDGLSDLLKNRTSSKPVLALVNDIEPSGIQGKIGVPWHKLGLETGLWLAARHPINSPPVDIAWFLGPKESGWSTFLDAGFREGIANSAVNIAITKWGDTGRLTQRRLVEEALEQEDKLRYLVGTAVMAEVAIAELRHRGLTEQTGLISSYMTPGTYNGLSRELILAAACDFPVLQGRLAIQQSIAHLEGRAVQPFVGPEVTLLSRSTAAQYPSHWMLPPAEFEPVYTLAPDALLPTPESPTYKKQH